MDWSGNVDIIAYAFACAFAFVVPLTILLMFFPPEVAGLGIARKRLARLFHRFHPDDDDAEQENPKALVREGDRVLTGRELYHEIASKNAAEHDADMKAWNEKRSDFAN